MCRLYYEKRTLDPIPPDEIDQLVDHMWDSWADEARVALEEVTKLVEEFRPPYPEASEFAKGVNFAARQIYALLKEEGNG